MNVNCSCPHPKNDCPSLCPRGCEACDACGDPVALAKDLQQRLMHAEVVLTEIGATIERKVHYYKNEPTYGQPVDKDGNFVKRFCKECGYSIHGHMPTSDCAGHKARAYLGITAQAQLDKLLQELNINGTHAV